MNKQSKLNEFFRIFKFKCSLSIGKLSTRLKLEAVNVFRICWNIKNRNEQDVQFEWVSDFAISSVLYQLGKFQVSTRLRSELLIFLISNFEWVFWVFWKQFEWVFPGFQVKVISMGWENFKLLLGSDQSVNFYWICCIRVQTFIFRKTFTNKTKMSRF